jgi:hypothetical protein
MRAPESDDDDRLLEELRAALREAGPPTPTMLAAGRAAFSWASVDAELATLTHDSSEDELAGVRGPTEPPRTLVFQAGQVSVEVELTDTGLVGQLVPPASGEVVLCRPDGDLAPVSVDELGCFHVERPPSGLVRLRCRVPAGVLLTDWIRI